MPYADKEVRKAYMDRYCREWDNANREKRRGYSNAWKKRNPENGRTYDRAHPEMRVRIYRKHRQTKQEQLNALKSGPCADCGGSFPPECMDFDHVRGEKIAGVSQLLTRSRLKAVAEIAKCELVCSNCHRIRTKARRQLLRRTA